MKNFITTLKHIWKIKELRNRILFTLLMIAVYRLGSRIVLPGVVPSVLENFNSNRNSNDLLGLINVFTGGAFNNAAIFALGIMPYITASIIIQLLGFAVPYFQRLKQKEGESGRKKSVFSGFPALSYFPQVPYLLCGSVNVSPIRVLATVSP